MNTDLSLGTGPRLQAPSPPGAQAAAPPVAPPHLSAPASTHSVPAAAAPAPKKVELQFNAEEMQKNLQEAIARINEQMERNGRNLNFSVDEVIDRTIITVKNRQSGEVVRQIPNEVLVRVAHNIEDIKGLLLNERI